MIDSVLSPHLFAIYVDDIINKVSSSKFSCFKRFICISIFVYADDIILLSPSVSFLQELIHLVEKELNQLEMYIYTLLMNHEQTLGTKL